MTQNQLSETLEQYRDRIDYDETAKITHPIDCYPGDCSLVGYLRDGTLEYQEQTGRYPVVDPETPDWNPRGCNRQCSFTDATYGEERIEQPMRQTGERGSDGWEPISWERAYEEIADAIIDAVEDNPQSVVCEQPPGEGGNVHGYGPFMGLTAGLGGVTLEENGLISDFHAGTFLTFGKFHIASSQDEFFKSELLLVWHGNPAYSRVPTYHYLTESRYDGGEVISIAPDYHPSAVHADRYVPVEPATDAALALGMCRVILDEGLADRAFIKEQTDLPLLVREDTDRFLREADLNPDGSDEHFYVWDRDKGLAPAPRETLALGDLSPVLTGPFEVDIEGEVVEVRPVFDRLRKTLEAEYDLETVREITGIHPDVVTELARKVATKRTQMVNTMNAPKIYHGDLIERAIALVMALSGNWGKPGTGIRGWNVAGEPHLPEARAGQSEIMESMLRGLSDRALSAEELNIDIQRFVTKAVSSVVPPVFWWHRHCGYDEIWDEADDGYPRDVSEYVREAVEEGWWEGLDLPATDVDPSVFLLPASNTLRRTMGGARQFLQELWPTLDLIICIDYRWSATALYSDIVLPAAFHHEKQQFHPLTSSANRFWAFADRAIEPRHNTKTEVRMVQELTRTIQERAAERELKNYDVPHGLTPDRLKAALGTDGDLTFEGSGGELARETFEGIDAAETIVGMMDLGTTRAFDTLFDRVTLEGLYTQDNIEEYLDAAIERSIADGVLPPETTLDEVKDRGFVKYTGTSSGSTGIGTASASVEPDETVSALTEHTENGQVYPTATGRAQFYIDHEWFLEAGEALPGHRDPPASMGGDRETYPYFYTSGHNRHSSQSSTMTNETQMNQHRGEPHMFISRAAAERKGVQDGDHVRVFNDFGEFEIQAKVSSLPSDDQVIVYHAWDNYLYPDGLGLKTVIPGLIKPLHLAGDYGHLEFQPSTWMPQLVDRHTTVDFEPVETDAW